jgi:hypothetical protein
MDESKVVMKGRLGPGMMITVDLQTGQVRIWTKNLFPFLPLTAAEFSMYILNLMNHPGAWKHRSEEKCSFIKSLRNLVARTHAFDKACQFPLLNHHGQWDCIETSTVRINQTLFLLFEHILSSFLLLVRVVLFVFSINLIYFKSVTLCTTPPVLKYLFIAHMHMDRRPRCTSFKKKTMTVNAPIKCHDTNYFSSIGTFNYC